MTIWYISFNKIIMKIKVTKHSEMLSMIFRVFSQLSGVSSFLDFRVGSCSNIVLSIHCVIVRPEADLMLHASQSVTPVKNRCPPSPELCSATYLEIGLLLTSFMMER